MSFQVAQLKIQLAAAPEFQEEQQQTPPAKKARVITDHRLEARVWQRQEIGVERRKEVADRANLRAEQF
jgi:hypothetical protein